MSADSFRIPRGMRGVLPSQWLAKAIDAGVVSAPEHPIPGHNLQPASLDLRLGALAYRLRASFLPDTRTVASKLDELVVGPPLDLTDGQILERNRPYLVPLLEQVSIPRGLRGRTNPKSSTGRLDVFTRVITDRGRLFDEIRPGYEGGLYLEIVPRSFTVMVRTGLSLNQLRLATSGDREVTLLSDRELLDRHRSDPMLLRDGAPARPERLVGNGLLMSLDLEPREGLPIGYAAKRNSRLIDLAQLDHYDPADYWEPIFPEAGRRTVLEPEEFYLLLSEESVRVPADLAGEMVAFDPTSGELRTHYAGFFDPGFGHDDAGAPHGSRATLEVRAHDVPFVIEHRQPVCKLVFEPLMEAPSVLYGQDKRSNYQSQQVTLSKHFRVDRRPYDRQLALDVARARRRAAAEPSGGEEPPAGGDEGRLL